MIVMMTMIMMLMIDRQDGDDGGNNYLYNNNYTSVHHVSQFHDLPARGAVPLAFGGFILAQPNALVVEPFYLTVLVVASNHIAKGRSLAEAVARFGGVKLGSWWLGGELLCGVC